MKKIALYLLAGLALGFASCDDKSDLGIAQTNPQEAIMSANGITVAYGSALTGNSYSLETAPEEIPVISLVSAENLPEGAQVSYQMEVAATSTYDDAQVINVTDGCVLRSDWNNAFQHFYGKNPNAQVNYVRFAAYVENGSQISRMGDADFYYAAKQLTVTPIDLKLPVEMSYTLDLDGTKIEMSHTAKHPYDDPVFTAIIETEGGATWTILSASGKKYGVSEVGDPSDMSGSLELDGAPGEINAKGNYRISVDMLDMSYTITSAYETLNTPGPANGWSMDNNMLLTTDDFTNYYGYVYIQDEFKFAYKGWDINWGIGGEEGTLASGGNNIKVSKNGLYYVTVDLNALTYTLTFIDNIGIIGGLNGWGSQINLTPSEDYKVWTGEATFTDADQLEWKFRCNDNWDYNLGGTMDNLVPNGDNLKVPATGTYTIKLDLGQLPYSCTIEAK